MTDEPRDKELFWLLKSERRNFFLCASGSEDPRAALCVFGSKGAAEEHAGGLSEAGLYLDTLERYGTAMPEWMEEETGLLPGPCEVTPEEVGELLEASGVEYVAFGGEGEPGAMEVLTAEGFLRRERQGGQRWSKQ